MDEHQANYDEAVGLLYESVLIPERLQEALGLITHLLDGDTSHLVGWERQSNIPVFSVSTGLPIEVGPEYAAHYAGIDPRRQLALTQRPGELLACHEHFDARFVGRDEFYQDYLIPRVGVHYLLGVNDLMADSGQFVILGFHRFVGHGPFQDGEYDLLKRLTPHLRRALSLASMHAARQQTEGFAGAALEKSNLAVLGLSGTGKLLWANERGGALIGARACLTSMNGVLKAMESDANDALQKAIRQCAKTGKSFNMSLASVNGLERCFMTLMAMPERELSAMPDSSAKVLALMTTSASRRMAYVNQLRDFFALSPAEARLVRAISRGESLEEYGAHEGLKRSTLKTQLRSATEKMGASNQRDIVRLVLPLAPVRE